MDYSRAKATVNNIIEEYTKGSTADPRITSGMKYVLGGGKRLRPVLTLSILEKLLPNDWEKYKQVCLVSEFIHTSSLIIDDLPAFDDASERRDKKCVHLARGEGLAYLLSFNLVTEALVILHNNLQHLKKVYNESQAYQRCETQLMNLVNNISSKRALGGQLMSTFHTSGNRNLKDIQTGDEMPPKLEKAEISDILHKKTSSFFEIAIVTGWITGGGCMEKLPEIKELGELLGFCYQVYDDFLDYHQDVDDSGHFSHNYIYHCGLEEAYADYLYHSNTLQEKLTDLNLMTPIFSYILDFMHSAIIKAKKDLQ